MAGTRPAMTVRWMNGKGSAVNYTFRVLHTFWRDSSVTGVLHNRPKKRKNVHIAA
jgi:hypothetical protein